MRMQEKVGCRATGSEVSQNTQTKFKVLGFVILNLSPTFQTNDADDFAASKLVGKSLANCPIHLNTCSWRQMVQADQA